MSRFLANWEVETDLTLSFGQPFVRYDHPNSKYTVFLRNIPGSRNDQTYLSMQFIFDAPSLTEARIMGEEQAKEFLDYLSFTSNLKIRLRTLLQIFDWEPGSDMRDCLYFSRTAANSDAPFEALDRQLLDTAALLQTQAPNPRLRRALKWFANGVASRYRDDQFAYFWFVIEVIAQIMKEPARAPDKCPTCRGPLHCPSCANTPLHRPYPKQAIEQLFARYSSDDNDEFYRHASEARNRLMHGDEIHAIEEALQLDFSDLVNSLGRFAWVSLLNQFVPVLLDKRPMFLETNQYVNFDFSGIAHMRVGFTPNFDDPDPSHFPKIQMSLIASPRQDIPQSDSPATRT
jgi:hypothetical protein